LFRQVFPNWLEDDGQPSSQAFHPWRDCDDGSLSVDRASLTTAEATFLLFTTPKPMGFEGQSAGVWGFTVGEIMAMRLVALEDAIAATKDTPANPAHALVNFHNIDRSRWKNTGRQLKVKAIDRGRIHPPTVNDATVQSVAAP
jgi:hypothetical protein